MHGFVPRSHLIGQFVKQTPSDDMVRIACSGAVVETVCQDHCMHSVIDWGTSGNPKCFRFFIFARSIQ